GRVARRGDVDGGGKGTARAAALVGDRRGVADRVALRRTLWQEQHVELERGIHADLRESEVAPFGQQPDPVADREAGELEPDAISVGASRSLEVAHERR